MKTVKTTNVIVLLVSVAFLLASGCTNWQQRYKALSVEHENVKGLLENCRQTMEVSGSETSVLADELSKKQQTINELERQIADLSRSPGLVTGFGERYQVDVDAAAGTITVTMPTTILFDSGKAILKKTSYSDLDHIVSVINQRYSGNNVDVVGHTDTDPIKKSKWKDNWQLSTERGLSVLRYLKTRGIPAARLRAVGAGPARPIASNTTRAGKAKNRRVEIVVNMR